MRGSSMLVLALSEPIHLGRSLQEQTLTTREWCGLCVSFPSDSSLRVTPSTMQSLQQLLEVLDCPNVTALRPEAIEEYPLTIRGPHWIVNSAFAVGKFIHLYWFTGDNRRYP